MEKIDRVNALLRFMEALNHAPHSNDRIWADVVEAIADELSVAQVKLAKRKEPAADDIEDVKPPTQALPDILTAQHIASFLGISRKRVYELTDLKPEYGGIPTFTIGKSKRVEKRDFVEWIKRQKGRTE